MKEDAPADSSLVAAAIHWFKGIDLTTDTPLTLTNANYGNKYTNCLQGQETTATAMADYPYIELYLQNAGNYTPDMISDGIEYVQVETE